MKSPKSEICVICGKEKACSRDHLPPKCIFPKPFPIDVITVPACAACNMERSGLDEKFKVFLGITVGYHLDGDKSYRPPVLRTLCEPAWNIDPAAAPNVDPSLMVSGS